MEKEYSFQEMVEAVGDPTREGELYVVIATLRQRYETTYWRLSQIISREDAISTARDMAHSVLRNVSSLGHGLLSGDPGHGLGHWYRDFVHALHLAHDPEIPTSVLVSGITAGILHDIGTVFVDRYADSKRVVRHAEVGALLVRAALIEAGWPEIMVDQVAYGIAAHTHYLRQQEVICADGVIRSVTPYKDTDDDGKPLLSVWLPRWVDRLDIGSPCYVGRHFITLHRDHEDYSPVIGFHFHTPFQEVMRPVLRSPEKIMSQGGKTTMLEHIQLRASSQDSSSPYGRHDFGVMCTLRDAYRVALEHVISQVAHPTDVNVDRILNAWRIFLGENIEPMDSGRTAAMKLFLNFRNLDNDTQRAWACGFRAVMSEYIVWADRQLAFLERLPVDQLRFPGILTDVCKIVAPNQSWVSILTAR